MFGISRNKFVILEMSTHSIKRAMEFTGTMIPDSIFEQYITKSQVGVILCIDGVDMVVPWNTAIIKRNESFILATEF